MFKLLAVFVAALILAYISEKNTEAITASGQHYTVWKDWAYIALVAMLILYTGLRTDYNDTWNYVNGFISAPLLAEFLSDSENLNPFTNPLFYFFQSLLKQFTPNGYVLIFVCSAFTQVCFVWFIRRYSTSFVFSIFLYFTLGTFGVTMAAMKQVLAMAVLFLSFPFFERKKWIKFYLIVFIAMLIHTYAIAFVFLPLLRKRPWRVFTFVFLSALVVLMLNFEETITAFMEQANELGKTLEDYEVFHEQGMNMFRVGVYAVVPMMCLVFQKRLFSEKNIRYYTFAHMSLVSLAFMVMGTQGGANMFGRMAHYFEISMICMLPWMLDRVFEKKSYRFVSIIAAACFMGFFSYANGWIG